MWTVVPGPAPWRRSSTSIPMRSSIRQKRSRDSSLSKFVRAAAVSMRRPAHAQAVGLGHDLPALGQRVEAVDDHLVVGRALRLALGGLVEGPRQARAKLLEPGAVVGADADGIGRSCLRSAGQRSRTSGRSSLVTTSGIGRSMSAGVVQAQLLGDRLPLLERILRGAVDDPDDDPRALDVAQEVVAQPAALVRALDEARARRP